MVSLGGILARTLLSIVTYFTGAWDTTVSSCHKRHLPIGTVYQTTPQNFSEHVLLLCIFLHLRARLPIDGRLATKDSADHKRRSVPSIGFKLYARLSIS